MVHKPDIRNHAEPEKAAHEFGAFTRDQKISSQSEPHAAAHGVSVDSDNDRPIEPDQWKQPLAQIAKAPVHDPRRTFGLDRIEVCYHAGKRYGQPCGCRKPSPGLIVRAAAELNIDPKKSYVIGDRWRDVDCARAAGCRAIFIERGYEESLREAPDFTVANFNEAVTAVLRDAGLSELLAFGGSR